MRGRGTCWRLRCGRRTCTPPIPSSCSRRPRARGSGCSCGSRSSVCSASCRPSAGSASPALRWRFALITGGLLASTAHLGRPERAWRAFSQWRTSWLSREGVMAVATYVPAGLLAIGWVFLETARGVFAPMALLTIVCAAADALHDRHDLRLAAHHPAMAPAADRADLHRARARQRRRAAQPAARAVRRTWQGSSLARHRLPGRRCGPQVALLAAHRRRGARVHHRGRHRPRPPRQGARARAAAHPAQLHHARDGLPRRPQARPAPAQAGAAVRLRRAHRHAAALAYARLRPSWARFSPPCRWRSASSSSAGCSSPRPSTCRCSTTAPMRRDPAALPAAPRCRRAGAPASRPALPRWPARPRGAS